MKNPGGRQRRDCLERSGAEVVVSEMTSEMTSDPCDPRVQYAPYIQTRRV